MLLRDHWLALIRKYRLWGLFPWRDYYQECPECRHLTRKTNSEGIRVSEIATSENTGICPKCGARTWSE